MARDDFIAYGDEVFTYGHAFFLRICKTGNSLKETFRRIFHDKVCKAELSVRFCNFCAFVLAHKSVVYVKSKYAFLTKCPVQKGKRNCRINSAAQKEKDVFSFRLFLYVFKDYVQYSVLIPVFFHSAERSKIFKNLVSARRVLYFAMELKAESFFRKVLSCRKRTVFCKTYGFKTIAHRKNSVLMAHPYLLFRFYSFKKRAVRVFVQFKLCKAEFACFRLSDFSVISQLHDVVPVAQS